LWLVRSVGCGDLVNRAGSESRPHLPSRVRSCPVFDEGAEDDIGEASFQTAQRSLLAFAGGDFAFVVGGACRVVAFVRQSNDVQGGVQSPVPGT
jgi:hypothetical protein